MTIRGEVSSHGSRVRQVELADQGEEMAPELQRLLLARSSAILPRLVARGTQPDPSATIEDLAGLGRRLGVAFIVRPSVLPAELASGEDERAIKARLWADVMAVDTMAVVSVRAEALESSLQIIERIQEIRAALRGAHEEEAETPSVSSW